MSGISKGENPKPRTINFLISGLYNGEKYQRSFSVFKSNPVATRGNIWGLGSGRTGVRSRHFFCRFYVSVSPGELRTYMSKRRRQHPSEPSTDVSLKFEAAKVPSCTFSIP